VVIVRKRSCNVRCLQRRKTTRLLGSSKCAENSAHYNAWLFFLGQQTYAQGMFFLKLDEFAAFG
jgi:hypothetical protein